MAGKDVKVNLAIHVGDGNQPTVAVVPVAAEKPKHKKKKKSPKKKKERKDEEKAPLTPKKDIDACTDQERGLLEFKLTQLISNPDLEKLFMLYGISESQRETIRQSHLPAGKFLSVILHQTATLNSAMRLLEQNLVQCNLQKAANLIDEFRNGAPGSSMPAASEKKRKEPGTTTPDSSKPPLKKKKPPAVAKHPKKKPPLTRPPLKRPPPKNTSKVERHHTHYTEVFPPGNQLKTPEKTFHQGSPDRQMAPSTSAASTSTTASNVKRQSTETGLKRNLYIVKVHDLEVTEKKRGGAIYQMLKHRILTVKRAKHRQAEYKLIITGENAEMNYEDGGTLTVDAELDEANKTYTCIEAVRPLIRRPMLSKEERMKEQNTMGDETQSGNRGLPQPTGNSYHGSNPVKRPGSDIGIQPDNGASPAKMRPVQPASGKPANNGENAVKSKMNFYIVKVGEIETTETKRGGKTITTHQRRILMVKKTKTSKAEYRLLVSGKFTELNYQVGGTTTVEAEFNEADKTYTCSETVSPLVRKPIKPREEKNKEGRAVGTMPVSETAQQSQDYHVPVIQGQTSYTDVNQNVTAAPNNQSKPAQSSSGEPGNTGGNQRPSNRKNFYIVKVDAVQVLETKLGDQVLESSKLRMLIVKLRKDSPVEHTLLVKGPYAELNYEEGGTTTMDVAFDASNSTYTCLETFVPLVRKPYKPKVVKAKTGVVGDKNKITAGIRIKTETDPSGAAAVNPAHSQGAKPTKEKSPPTAKPSEDEENKPRTFYIQEAGEVSKKETKIGDTITDTSEVRMLKVKYRKNSTAVFRLLITGEHARMPFEAEQRVILKAKWKDSKKVLVCSKKFKPKIQKPAKSKEPQGAGEESSGNPAPRPVFSQGSGVRGPSIQPPGNAGPVPSTSMESAGLTPTSTSVQTSSNTPTGVGSYLSTTQEQMVQWFFQDYGVIAAHAQLYLAGNGWDYIKAGERFLALKGAGMIPPEAFARQPTRP